MDSQALEYKSRWFFELVRIGILSYGVLSSKDVESGKVPVIAPVGFMQPFRTAENITGTLHNIYTLPGALVPDALAWPNHINMALYRYGQLAALGNGRIQEVMRNHTQPLAQYPVP